MPMIASTTNRMILDWAMGNNYGFRLCKVAGFANHCLRIKLNHATVLLHDGRLVRMAVAGGGKRGGKRSGQLAMEMASLFALCGFIKSRDAASSVKKPGAGDDVASRPGCNRLDRAQPSQRGISSVKSLRNTTASMAKPTNEPLSSRMALPTSENASLINNMPDSLRRDPGLKLDRGLERDRGSKDFENKTDFGW